MDDPKRILLSILALGVWASLHAAPQLTIREARWDGVRLKVNGLGAREEAVLIFDASTRRQVGSAKVEDNGVFRFESSTSPVPCTVRVESGGSAAMHSVKGAPSTCVAGSSSPAVLTEVLVAGPVIVPENSTARFTATAVFNDGSRQDVTASARWGEDSNFAQITAGQLSVSEILVDQLVVVTAAYASRRVTQSGRLSIQLTDSTPSRTGSHAGRFAAFLGTSTCLTCHRDEALEVHGSVHYQWKGDSSAVIGSSGEPMGKLGGINDFCIYPDINWIGKLTNTRGQQVDGGCGRCHAGLGLKPSAEATGEQLLNIDCLVCHSDSYRRKVDLVNGQYRFVPDSASMEVSVLEAAQDVALPSSRACLNCHAFAGGGDNYKRGDLEAAHVQPSRGFDVHMASRSAGGAGLDCLDCHTAEGHRIAGRGSDLRELDSPDRVQCRDCHNSTHPDERIVRHLGRVDCTVCHIPDFAQVAATDMDRRWDLPGDLDPTRGLFEPHMVKQLNVIPEYRFFNGRSYFYQFGQPAIPDPETGWLLMSGPAGDVREDGSRIFPFKHHKAAQPMDPVTFRLLPLKIGIFFSTGDVGRAVAEGTTAVGWAYNGHSFADTERYMGIFHEVAPAEQALGCSQCHGTGSRMDFDALGYGPKTTRNGRPLCSSCHEDESDEWSRSEFFTKVHDKHVRDKRLDCSNCHSFQAAARLY